MRLLTIAVFCLCLSATSQTESSRLGGSEYPEFLEVPGGTFSMGDEWMTGYVSEQPVHDVRLRGFKISKTEVTVKQYRTYCKKTGRKMPEPPSWGWIDDHPMVFVNWRDCMAYCEWLSEVTGGLCRLPTEAEWEYAARGAKPDKGFKYSGSQDIFSVAWFRRNNNLQTRPVAGKDHNKLGLYDMSGNVFEWCMDWGNGSYYDNSPIDNPQGPRSGNYRVIRGGGWHSGENYCRVAYRYFFNPDGRVNDIGFRVVRE